MADELEVSVRTIYRDMDQLSAAGIPVIADRGCTGGFKLIDGFRAQLGSLTAAEAETLFLASLPSQAAELGLAELTGAARTKLLAALPLGSKTEQFGSRFHLDARGWFTPTEPVPQLPTIAQAVRKSRLLRIRYGGDRNGAWRNVGPAGLVLKGGVWYLVAQKNDTFRTYRVARITMAEVIESPYIRPLHFDLPAHWERSSHAFEVSSYRLEVIARLSPRGRSLLGLLGHYVEKSVSKTASAPDGQGWVRCKIPLEDAEFGIRELMRLGQDVEVISPRSLRKQVEQTLRQTLQNYSEILPKRSEAAK
jgi:predicted DNA-binding transcriptional regulator YafY